MADCRVAAELLDDLPRGLMVHADKGYDSDAIRRQIEAAGSVPNIPPKSNRKWKNCFSPYLYRGRNAIERMFGRLNVNAGAIFHHLAGAKIHQFGVAEGCPQALACGVAL